MKILILSFGFSFLINCDLFSQNQFQEEYAVINEKFNPTDYTAEGEAIEVFYKTSELRFWVGLLRSEGNLLLGKDCGEVNEFINNNIAEIEKRIHDIPNVILDPSRLEGRIKLSKHYDSRQRKITFPLIVGNYSFMLIFNDTDQVVVVFRKNSNGEWKNACNIILYHSPLLE